MCPLPVDLTICWFSLGLSAGHLLGKSWPLCFPLVLFYFMPFLFVPFPCCVWGRKRNSTVSVPDHCLFIQPITHDDVDVSGNLNSKRSEKSDCKTGGYISFKLLSDKNSIYLFWPTKISAFSLDIENHTFFHWFWMGKLLIVSLCVLFVLRFISETFLSTGKGFSSPPVYVPFRLNAWWPK